MSIHKNIKNFLLLVAFLFFLSFYSEAQNEKILDGRPAQYKTEHKGYIEALVNLDSIKNYFSGEPIYLSKNEELKKNLRIKIQRIIVSIEEYNKLDQNNPEVLFYLGKSYSYAHDLDISGAWKKSVKCLNEVIRLDPNNMMARLIQAKNYMDNNEPKKALNEYEIVNKKYPNGQALRFMGLVKLQLKDVEGAKKDLKEYLKYNSNDLDTKKMLSAIEDGNVKYN